jgi:hypothetical protein
MAMPYALGAAFCKAFSMKFVQGNSTVFLLPCQPLVTKKVADQAS